VLLLRFEYMFDRISQHLPTDNVKRYPGSRHHGATSQLTFLRGENRYFEVAVNSPSRAARVLFIASLLCAGKPAHSSNHGTRLVP
jgi:hypothetical protein